MTQEKSLLYKRIESGKPLIIAEMSPPASSDAGRIKIVAKAFAGHVHALGVSDNRDKVTMSALAAASIIAAEGVEPILHMTTRDRNRAALVSDFLGAQAIGIRNILCTSGSHQTLGQFRSSKNVFDIDATILLQSISNIGKDASIVGAEKFDVTDSTCLGAVASPYADPIELQISRLAQKIFVGARFIVTQPVFDVDLFGVWWNDVKKRGLHQKAAFIAGIRILTDARGAQAYAGSRPSPAVPDTILKRLTSASGSVNCRKEGIAVALETIEKLSALEGLRGFEISCDEDTSAAMEVLQTLRTKLE
jgi:methylenetetrahydrofolate reductase (NADPH)